MIYLIAKETANSPNEPSPLLYVFTVPWFVEPLFVYGLHTSQAQEETEEDCTARPFSCTMTTMKTEKRPSPASSLLALSLEHSLRSRLSVSFILSSLLLLLLFHQSLFSILSSSSSRSISVPSLLLQLHHGSSRSSASHANLFTDMDLNKTSSGNHAFAEEVRTFQPYGSAAALFVVYGAYRGGPNTFAVVGLGSKPLYVYGKPEFECFWVPSTSSSTGTENTQQPIKSKVAYAMQPDVGYGRVYTVVVVNCTFGEAVGTSTHQRRGQLLLHASYGDGLGKLPERIVALEEDEQSYNAALFEPPYPYEFMYCGSPLFSNLNAQRMREWMAYHVMKFGHKSHFIFHDAGGMHEGVRAVLEPWRKLGFITIQDVKQTKQYDGYYYNQFLILNDCLHRTKFMANWTFFFDVDEYIYNPPYLPLRSVLDFHANCTMLVFKQLRMSESSCQFDERENDTRWTFEKLVYGEEFNDVKYAVQARRVYATGVHKSQKELGHMEGDVGWAWWPHMRFYHYHNTISRQGKLCNNITHNSSSVTVGGRTYDLDTSMVSLAPLVRAFEHSQIGTPF